MSTVFAPPEQTSASNTEQVWREFFQRWPAGMPQTGVVVTSFNEQVPFIAFMYTEQMVMLERRAPDTLGARKVFVPFSQIAALKLVDVIQEKTLQAAGFKGKLPK